MKVFINSDLARCLAPRRTNIAKTDDAASTIRQYVAALMPANSGFSGFFLDRNGNRNWRVRRLSRRINANLTGSRAILQAFDAYFLVYFLCLKTI
jgi:hypothetical protein